MNGIYLLKKNRIKTIISFMLILFCSLLSTKHVYSEESSSVLDHFTWEIIPPKSQKEKKLGYYDILIEPGKKETLQLRMSNTSNDEMIIDLATHSAKTNGSGEIEYAKSDIKQDKSLINPLPEIVEYEKEIVIPANKSVVTELIVTAPKENFDGVIAGGIQMTPRVVNEDNEEMISNKYSFGVGVLIKPLENELPKANLELNKVYQKTSYDKQDIYINFSNTEAVYAENMKINVEVKKSGKEKALFEVSKDNMRMAPNSMIDFPVPMEEKILSTGNHIVYIDVEVDGNKWNWVETIDIKNTLLTSQFEKIESPTKEKKTINRGFVIVIGMIMLIFIVGIIVLILFNMQKREGG